MSTSLDSRRKVSIAIRYLQSKIVKIHTVKNPMEPFLTSDLHVSGHGLAIRDVPYHPACSWKMLGDSIKTKNEC